METTVRIAEQHENRGYFVSLTLRASLATDVQGLHVEIHPSITAWTAGLQFGLHYAFEKTFSGPGGVRVIVTELRGMAVDTSEVLVAYAAARAYCDAMGIQLRRPLRLDLATGEVVFPK